ncbi:MAG: choice-of-anchor L domain-containing protein [Betaproteobacteria bacterium]|nr:choice-of-anchor L domain-containing protein [Betaproteobacteria bacterium]
MKRIRLAAMMAALLGFSGASHAGLVVDSLESGDTTVEAMVNSLLSNNSGITVSNIQYTGANIASGTFSGGSGILGFENGIVLTTGNANFVIGPNNGSGYSYYDWSNQGPAGDSMLDQIASGPTYDAAVISFDFVPTGNFVEFTYVFGSEEYSQFVNSDYNDVFGFFINGVNYALVPGTDDSVSINTINCGGPTAAGAPANHVNETNCEYYRDNPSSDPSIDIQLDGLTTVLTVRAPVNAGEVNTMYLAIANVMDPLWDSAVFLEAGSLTSCGAGSSCNGGGSSVPEPSMFALVGLGFLGLGVHRKMAKRSA